MAVLRRYYINVSDVSGATEDQVALAEELIDRYVGPQDRFLRAEYHGEISAISNGNKTFADTGSGTALDITNGYFSGVIMEMVSGAAVGQRAVIESSNKANKTVSVRTAFSTTPAVGDVFKIFQLAKFPRQQDIVTSRDSLNQYATIPEAVREATIAQTKYIMAQGDDFFIGGGADMQSESFLNYSYTRGEQSTSAISNLMSPQARELLRGIMNRKGTMFVGGSRVRKYPV